MTRTVPRGYAERALADEVADVAGAAHGTRNDRLNRAAYALGGLVAIGQLDENTVRDRLTRAGRDAGLALREVKKAVKSGLRAGLRNPRTIPDRGSPSPPSNTPAPTSTPAPTYPPIAEVRDLWERCGPVDLDAVALAWMRSRGLDAARVVDADVARALPPGSLPSWATCCSRSWAGAYGLVTRMYDAAGELRSLHARRTCDDDTLPKGASPADFNARGLVLADALGRGLLAGRDDARDLVLATSSEDRPGVVIVEGAPDFLSWLAAHSDADEHAPAVLGILAGSWTEKHAARIPDGARVVVDTDHDEAGQRYAEKIRTTFKGRQVDLLRAKPRTV